MNFLNINPVKKFGTKDKNFSKLFVGIDPCKKGHVGRTSMIRAYIALCILFVFSYAQAVQVSIEDNGNIYLGSTKGTRDYSAGDTIRLDATTRDGYAFDEWKMDNGGNCVIDDAHSRSTFATAYEGGLCRFRPYAKEQSFYYELTPGGAPTVLDFKKYSTTTGYSVYGVRVKVKQGGKRLVLAISNYTQRKYPSKGHTGFDNRMESAGSFSNGRLVFYSDEYEYSSTPYDYYIAIPEENIDSEDKTATVQAFLAYYLSTKVEGGGSVKLGSSGSVLIEGDTQTVSATPSKGYRFGHWKTTGGCSVDDENSVTATITMGANDCVVTAVFNTGEVYELSSTPKSFNFAEDAFLVDGNYDLRTKFTAPATGTYVVEVKTNRSIKYIDNGQNSSFNGTTEKTLASNGQISLSMSAGKSYYILFRQVEGYGTDDIQLVVKRKYVLSYDISGSGSYSTKNCDPDSSYSISAGSKYGKMFDKWNVVSGTCKIDDAYLATTKVQLSTNCSVKALFKDAPILPITETPVTYKLSDDGYVSGTSYRMNTGFVPTDSGTYRLTIKPALSTSFYLYDDGSDKTFPSTTGKSYSGTTTRQIFLGSVDTDGRYFLFSSGISQSLTLNVDRTYHIELEGDEGISAKFENGSSHDTTHINGESIQISATASSGKRFSYMKVTSGNCTLDDSASQNAKVTVDGDCKITVFSEDDGGVYPISTTPSEFNYGMHRSEIGSSFGIRTVFTAPEDGWYTLFAKGNLANNVWAYDETFTTRRIVSSNVFSATEGEKYYFYLQSTNTSYSPDKNDTLSVWVVKNVNVSSAVSGAGTVKVNGKLGSSDDKFAGDSISIVATADDGSRFDHWEKVSGSCTIRDTAKVSTFVALAGDCKVKAFFVEGKIFEISETPKSLNYLKDGVMRDGYMGIQTYFDAPAAGIYKFTVSSNMIVLRYRYSDETFETSESYNLPNVEVIAEAGKHYYFFRNNHNLSQITSADSILVSVKRNYRVHVDTLGKGYITINGYSRYDDSTATAGDTLQLVATPYTNFKFKKWNVVSGSCTLSDKASAVTTVTVKGDCNLEAHFAEGEIYSVTDTPKEYTFKDNYYSGSATNGVRFRFVAPDDGKFGIVVKRKNQANYVKYYKCANVACTSSSINKNVYTAYIDSVTVSKGDSVSFKVVPYNAADADEDTISVYYVDLNEKRLVIKLLADSLGSVTPSAGYTDVISGMDYSIDAVATRFGYRFDQWSVKSGDATIANKNTSYTSVSTTSDATVQAHFRKGDVYEVDETVKSFVYSTDYYSDSVYRDKYEVALKWTPKDTGTFFLDIESPRGCVYVFGSNSTFRSYNSYTNFTNKYSLPVTVKNKGETLYWTIAPYSSSYYNNSFTVTIRGSVSLKVIAGSNGSLSSKSEIKLGAGQDTTVTAYGNMGYVFDKWRVVSGGASIKSLTSRSTKVTVNKDAVIEATFRKGSIQDIGYDESEFTFNKDKYTDNGGFNNHVFMTWTAPDSGAYFVDFDISGSSYLYSFGTDSTFSRSSSKYYYSGKNSVAFTGASGVPQYWALGPYYASDTSDSYNVKISKGYELSVNVDASMGTINTDRKIALHKGRDTTITASSKVGYFFDGWSKVSGSVTIADTTVRSIKVSVESDATIKAKFHKGPVQKIGTTAKTFTFNKDVFTDHADHLYDVALTWTAPDSGWYTLEIESPDSNITRGYFWKYDTDSTFSGSYSTYTLPISYLFQGAAGVPQYWSFQRYSYADSSKRFTAKIVKSADITVVSDGHGSVTPTTPKPASLTSSVSITATSDFGYKFKEWVITSGTPDIKDVKSANTTVKSADNATVKATFSKGTIHALGATSKDFVFAKDFYTDTAGFKNLVFMSWTAPDTNWYFIEVSADSAINLNLYSYGTDLKNRGGRLTKVNGKSILTFQGTKGATHYWSLGPAYARDSLVGFSAKIAAPYVLTVESADHGTVHPNGAVVLPSGGDTTVMAIPYGGYVFSKWTVTKGNVIITNPISEKTKVSPIDSVCSIKANYVVDLTTVPKVDIQGIKTSGHPEICSIVSVVDSNSGKSIFDLDSSDFVLFEDGKSLPATVTSPKNVMGVSVVFVVDESASISSIQTAAREYVTRFVNEMEEFDRVAIVGYVDTVRVVQDYTSNRDTLLAAVNRLKFTGAYEDIALGAYTGVDLGSDLGGPKAIIVFSDGMSDHKKFPASTVVELAERYATSIYTIAFKKSASFDTGLSNYGFDILQDMAAGTGGRYYETAGISETREILAQIRHDMQTRYTVCYTTPDTIIDGDIHHVKIGISYRGHKDSDTASWREDFLPPKVTLTRATAGLVGKEFDSDSLKIGVLVSSRLSMASVKAFVRTHGDTLSAYKQLAMKKVKDSTWTVIVPESYLVSPGIDFYVIATDSLGRTGNVPSVYSPERNPYTIYLKNLKSSIALLTEGCVDTVETKVKLSFNVRDVEGVDSVKLYYRNSDKEPFDTLPMVRRSRTSNYWDVMVLSKAFGGSKLQINAEAWDVQGEKTTWLTTEKTFIEGCEPPPAPDEKDYINIVNGDSAGKAIGRTTKKIRLTLESQDFSPGKDTLKVSLSCLSSGDIESNLKVAEKKSGYYEITKDIEKNEYAPKRGDGKISCDALDTLVAEFKDPVYKTVARNMVVLSDDIKIAYRFLKKKNDADLDSIETNDSVAFVLRVTAGSKSLYTRDTIKVALFTDTGDTIKLKAVETGEYSSEYETTSAFYFVEDKKELKSDRLDAVFNYKSTNNRIKIHAEVDGDKSSLKSRDSLIVYSNYSAADYAEIYDSDKDGRADSIRIHFIERLSENIVSIDTVFWNVGGKTWKKASKSKMRLSEDSRWVESIIEEPFDYGVTFADEDEAPYLRMTKTAADRSQKVELRDKIGPVAVKAEKHPGRVQTEEYIQDSYGIPPDTLIVEMSEAISTKEKKEPWKNLFRYSARCSDTASMALRIQGEPKVSESGKEWTIVLKDNNLLVDNCIRTNPASGYVDGQKNTVGIGGVSVGGKNSDIYLYEVSSNIRLLKKNKKPKWIPPEEKEWELVPDSLQTIRISSIAPYKARVIIYDNYSNVVTSFNQSFTKEEMEMDSRGNENDHSKLGFLYWNERSSEGRKVGDGVYIWRIDFRFNDGHKEYRVLKTGVKRHK